MKPVLPLPLLMLVTEPSDRMVDIALEAVKGGVNVVQFRNRSASVKDLYIKDILSARAQLRDSGAFVIVNSYSFMAAESILPEGYHAPEEDDFAQYRMLVGERWLVGRSVHSVKSAIQTANLDADYLIAGTIFRSPSHPAIRPQGLGFLADVCRKVQIPVIAIGGVTSENAKDCLAAGAAGVAVLSPIMRAENPRQVAEAYWKALNA